MNLTFYDTETTGTSTDFDQILQFAAIHTDADLREIDRVEMRCRLRPDVVPHPAALRVTGMSIGRVADPALPCHYDMMRRIRAKLLEWSPSIFVGYNSMRFDEQLIRQALFKTLHPSYLTNTGGNRRADALSLMQAASAFSPGCLEIPMGENDRPSFKLDRLAPLNGFAHENAHDALADVEATIHLARCVRDRAPAAWARFLLLSDKGKVRRFTARESAFLVTAFHFNLPTHVVASPIGEERTNPAVVLALDLSHDPAVLAALDDEALSDFVRQAPRPLRRIRTNASPTLSPLCEVPDAFLQGLPRPDIRTRADRLRADRRLRERLLNAAAASAAPREPSPHVEERLYDGFPSRADEARMMRFHDAEWPARLAIVEAFEDDRLRYYGRRLIHEAMPDLLTTELRDEIETQHRLRLMQEMGEEGKWTSLPSALAEIERMMTMPEVQACRILTDYRSYLAERIKRYVGAPAVRGPETADQARM